MAAPGLPDWRDAEAYAPLFKVERAALAWEWLRRDEGYRSAAACRPAIRPDAPVIGQQRAAARWGLHAFEDPSVAAPAARPVWRAADDGSVLTVTAEPWRADEDSFELDRLLHLATLVQGRGKEHLLLSDGRVSLRIDVAGASLGNGSVRFSYALRGFKNVDPTLHALRRLLILVRTGGFPSLQRSDEARARRMVTMLRAADARAAGASQREIAAELLSGEAEAVGWRDRAPWLRSRAQRLVHSSRILEEGAWRQLLKG